MTRCKIANLLLIMILALGLSGCAKQVKSVSLDRTTITVINGNKFTLKATVIPNDAADRSVAWSVDTQSVSALTNENTLQKEFVAINVGEANIKVISSNGLKAICKITVTENAGDTAIREKAEEKARIAKEKADEEARLAAQKKAEEDRVAKVKAGAEEKRGYETGITYSQLARTPDGYKGKKVKFYGRVIQVIEGKGETNLRIATKSTSYGTYHDDVVLVYYDPEITFSRVLEEDMVIIYGVSKGLHTYQSTMGGNITIPLISVDKIEIQ